MLNFTPATPTNAYNFYQNKDIENLNIYELAYVHLSTITSKTKLLKCFLSSSLYDLRETLIASFNNTRTNQYVPLMTSFAILDQLGELYTPPGKSSKKQNGIKRCLEMNTSLTKNDIESLVSLRNGLLHNGSLVCEAQNSKQTNVVYRLSKTEPNLIKHSTIIWDGVYRDEMKDYISIVNLLKMKELVLQIHEDNFNHLINNKLIININDPKEFYFRFLFATR
ncbi:hypothetical protein ACLEYI_21995 [Enterobacter ludwigii]|uniref:hypothetical protein n=1 Tax=Enterobacter ludwigii TaxID=299767 RepID=UPI003976153D